MGEARTHGLAFDAGALLAFEQGSQLVRGLVRQAKNLDAPVVIPAGVLAQVWRNGSRQARLAALLSDRHVRVEALTASLARAAGELCGRRHTSDVIDASVILAARRLGGVVVTSDPDDLRQLDPRVTIVAV
jgi:predicted nucleic acid-binding protein